MDNSIGNYDNILMSTDLEALEKEGKTFIKGKLFEYDKLICEYIIEVILIEIKEGTEIGAKPSLNFDSKEKCMFKFKTYVIEARINNLTSGKNYKQLYKITSCLYENGVETKTIRKIDEESSKITKYIKWIIMFMVISLIIIFILFYILIPMFT